MCKTLPCELFIIYILVDSSILQKLFNMKIFHTKNLQHEHFPINCSGLGFSAGCPSPIATQAMGTPAPAWPYCQRSQFHCQIAPLLPNYILHAIKDFLQSDWLVSISIISHDMMQALTIPSMTSCIPLLVSSTIPLRPHGIA